MTWRDAKICVIVVILQILDWLIIQLSTGYGVLEVNPFVRLIFAHTDNASGWFLALKILGGLILAVIFIHRGRGENNIMVYDAFAGFTIWLMFFAVLNNIAGLANFYLLAYLNIPPETVNAAHLISSIILDTGWIVFIGSIGVWVYMTTKRTVFLWTTLGFSIPLIMKIHTIFSLGLLK